MSETVNKFLLAGDEFMPETYSVQPKIYLRTCGSFTGDKDSIRIYKETGMFFKIL